MAAALIETIRHGQAVLADQLLADLGVQRGLVTPEQSSAALATVTHALFDELNWQRHGLAPPDRGHGLEAATTRRDGERVNVAWV